jgi:adenosylmethionine-8-amino-7-oxononanoate aminotransferase
MYYVTSDGRKLLEGTAGLWRVNAGHGRKRIAEAVERQLLNLDFAPTCRMGSGGSARRRIFWSETRSHQHREGADERVRPNGSSFCESRHTRRSYDRTGILIELFHGYTCSGHPVGCAAGLATLEIYIEEMLLTRSAELAIQW